MSSRDFVTLRSGDLERLAARYRQLGVDFGRSMQSALNEVATSSLKRLAAWSLTNIDGGPTRWTKIRPGAASGGVLILEHIE